MNASQHQDIMTLSNSRTRFNRDGCWSVAQAAKVLGCNKAAALKRLAALRTSGLLVSEFEYHETPITDTATDRKMLVFRMSARSLGTLKAIV